MIANPKVPFGKAKHSPIKNVRYLSWEDVFDVEFDDGLCILEQHATIRRANKIAPKAKFKSLEIEDWTRSSSTTTTVRLPKSPGRLCVSCHRKTQRNDETKSAFEPSRGDASEIDGDAREAVGDVCGSRRVKAT